MGAISFLKDTVGLMNPLTDYIDSGWQIGNGVAIHNACNPGYMINSIVPGLIPGRQYQIEYDVLDYTSGSVNFILGDTIGSARAAAGNYSETLLLTDTTNIRFYSNGSLSIGNLIIYDLANEGAPITVAFSEKHKLWVNQQSIVPEAMVRFGDDLFTFYQGSMYKQDSNQVRNNFYGVQYNSQITFYINSEPNSIKLFSTLIEESSSVWTVTNVTIKPYPGKSLGMQSRIKSGKFKRLQGVFWADFLRNMLDPNFDTQLKALLYGEELRGRVMEITIQNADTVEATLFAVDVKYTKQMLTP